MNAQRTVERIRAALSALTFTGPIHDCDNPEQATLATIDAIVASETEEFAMLPLDETVEYSEVYEQEWAKVHDYAGKLVK